MSQNDSLRLAQEFLGRMGSGAEPAEIAKLFSESVEWETKDHLRKDSSRRGQVRR
jgi:hypothetical protein